MKQKASSRYFKWLVVLTFLAFATWWLYIATSLRDTDHNTFHNQAFAATYGVVAIIGGVIGLVASKKWGGWHSALGKALIFFSLGLFAQEFGQIAYSIYQYAFHIEIPYPSIGDIGYFGSVLLYIYAVILLAKVVGVKFSIRDKRGKIIALVLPLMLLGASYAFFLRDYQFDWSHPLTVFLDFGYPLGQALYIAIALLTYILSRKMLGGIMKNRILFILFALLVQYIADFSWLEAAKRQTAFPGGANDFMYLLAYTVMSLALLSYLSLNLTHNTAEEPQSTTSPKQISRVEGRSDGSL